MVNQNNHPLLLNRVHRNKKDIATTPPFYEGVYRLQSLFLFVFYMFFQVKKHSVNSTLHPLIYHTYNVPNKAAIIRQ